jgi:hypothetical protein
MINSISDALDLETGLMAEQNVEFRQVENTGIVLVYTTRPVLSGMEFGSTYGDLFELA